MDDRVKRVPLAHSANDVGEVESLAVHIEAVARTAAEFATAFGASDELRLCGLLHDIGKLDPAFQERLRGAPRRVDHCSIGAWHALSRWKENGLAAAACIWGHHQGLQRLADLEDLRGISPDSRRAACKRQRIRLGEIDLESLLDWFDQHGIVPPKKIGAVCPMTQLFSRDTAAASMLDIRMLYSCLVDADFLETEAHFQAPVPGERYARPVAPELRPDEAWACLERYLDDLRSHSNAPRQVQALREDLFSACCKAAIRQPGLFTLSAPTGAGKTLAMLAFALRHCIIHGLRRIVVVLPYLTIIEQTAGIYRDIFEAVFGDRYVLEHHSLVGRENRAGSGTAGEDSIDEVERTRRLTAENWDAPIVLTTSVQFFESLFANRPAACRKLHRLAGSVILFDEAQTFPVPLAVPTLATLSRLSQRYQCSVVFSTATQPAFSHLDKYVRKLAPTGWEPSEIVPPELDLFDRAKRVDVRWPKSEDRTITWGQLADRLAVAEQVLCVVNLKRHAIELVEQLKDRVANRSLLHLSTNMCPAHRTAVLDHVRDRLKRGDPCRLVSTQCVEAGVDLDFPAVYRAMGPLDAIAQAAGRCNRNGRRSSAEVHVFIPEDEGYPPGAYRHASQQTKALLRAGPIDINDPTEFDRYFRTLYDLHDFEHEELVKLIRQRDFPAVAEKYRLIDQLTINVLVPYDQATFDALINQVEKADRLSPEQIRGWCRRATPHAVSLYRPNHDQPILAHLMPISFGRVEPNGETARWFHALPGLKYDDLIGIPQEFESSYIM